MKLIDFIKSEIFNDICIQIFSSLKFSKYEKNYSFDFMMGCMKKCCIQYFIDVDDFGIGINDMNYIDYVIGREVEKRYSRLVRSI